MLNSVTDFIRAFGCAEYISDPAEEEQKMTERADLTFDPIGQMACWSPADLQLRPVIDWVLEMFGCKSNYEAAVRLSFLDDFVDVLRAFVEEHSVTWRLYEFHDFITDFRANIANGAGGSEHMACYSETLHGTYKAVSSQHVALMQPGKADEVRAYRLWAFSIIGQAFKAARLETAIGTPFTAQYFTSHDILDWFATPLNMLCFYKKCREIDWLAPARRVFDAKEDEAPMCARSLRQCLLAMACLSNISVTMKKRTYSCQMVGAT